MNLAALTPWSAENPFIDRFKNASQFYLRTDTYRGDVDSTMVDSNGWPINLPAGGHYGFSLTLDPADSGETHHFVMTYSGTGTFSMVGVHNPVLTGTNRIEFDADPSILIEYTMSNSDPIHDIHIVRADQEAAYNAGELFNPDFLAQATNWSVLRFMDWNQTNNNLITSWSQRGQMSEARWTDVPIEVEVALANKVHSDMWVNIPDEANDDYVRQLTTYVRDHLDAGLKLHLEYSNEVWNNSFYQSQYTQNKANALWGNGSNVWFGNEIYYGYRAAQIMAIAKDVFGASADQRFVGSLGIFTGYTGVEQTVLDGVSRANLGSVSSLFKEYAVTTYFGDQMGSTNPNDEAKILGWAESGAAGMDAAFNELAHGGGLSSDFSLDNWMNYWRYHGQVAAANGLTMVAYEGGFSSTWFGWPSDKQGEVVDFMKRLMADPRFGDLYTKMVQDFAAAGGTELTAYADVGLNTIWGPWGTNETLYDSSPRYQALVALSNHSALNPLTSVDPTHTSLATVTMADGLTQITYDGTAAFTATGNALDNVITGGDGGNHLYGGGGNDTLTGGAGADWLDGGTGADRLVGGAGNDTYIVDNAGDVVVENVNQGIDEVRTTLATYTLPANVENLTFTGTGAFTGTGNELDNVIRAGDGGSHLYGGAGSDTLYGGAGADWLDGGTGADRMVGGTGDDVYVVDDAGDVVVENANEGMDEVRTTLAAYTLPANVEKLTFTGTGAFTGTGNELDNVITGGDGGNHLYGGVGNDTLIGGAGDDWLDGGTGTDTMTGGAGNDTYIVDNVGDVVVELPGGGIDTVRTSLASYTLGANVENLTYTGTSAFTGTGNELDNIITGSATAANKLYGGAGNDTLYGGSGNDTLDGGTGTDTMIGGGGNDIYIVRDSSDVVVEQVNGGLDEVRSYANTYTLSANVENLTFVGTGDFTGTGNAGSNLITGGNGNDHLYGGTGADLLIGGTGDDTYIVDNVGDRVYENANEGYDTIYSSVSYTLPVNVERLILTGSANLNATGNAAANALVGNAGNNVLDGGAGNDTLTGGGGVDLFIGGSGADTFVFRPGDLLAPGQTTSRIADCSHGEGDKIDFSALRASPGVPLSFIGNGAFGHHAGEVREVADGNNWDLSIDLNGDGMADVHLTVTSRTGALVASDFLL